jgi:hypothetical protein
VGLAALLEQIEAAAKRQDIASAREFIARLEAEYAAAHQALRAACDGKS